MKIAIFGSYNGTSIGDTAILLGLLRAISLARPDAEISVLNMGPIDLSQDRKLAGLSKEPKLVRANAWAFEELPVLSSLLWRIRRFAPYGALLGPINSARCKAFLADKDLLIIGGGNLLMDLFDGGEKIIETICGAATRASTPYCFVGVGAGPIDSSRAKDTLTACLSGARVVIVRDDISLQLCRQVLGYPDAVRAPDLAFALQGAAPAPAERTSLALNVAAIGDKTWPRRDEAGYRAFVDGFVRLARAAVTRRRPDRIDIVSTNANVDQRAADDVLAALTTGPQAVARPATIAACRDVTDVLAVFSRAELAITTRLHAGILASVAGCRVLPVAYDRKVKSVLEEERIADRAIELNEISNPDHDMGALFETFDSRPTSPPRDIASEVIATVKNVLACAG